jgi:hypothetical protein
MPGIGGRSVEDCFPLMALVRLAIGHSDSDFSTLVAPAPSPYNPSRFSIFRVLRKTGVWNALTPLSSRTPTTQWTHFTHPRFFSSGSPSAAF